MNTIKFAYFGSGRFSLTVLEKLVSNGYKPSILICNPDKPKGRKQIITPPETKIFIQNNLPDTKIIQPKNKKELLLYKSELSGMQFGIVASYSHIIPNTIIDVFKYGILGVHPSLLPKYRGASPIQSILLNGEKYTGTTIYLLDEKTDNGPIFKSKLLQISQKNNTYKTLEKELADIGAELLIEMLPSFLNQQIHPTSQNESEATYTKKIMAENGLVNLKNENPTQIARKIRALNPEPGVYTFIDNKRVKLLEVEEKDNNIIITKITPSGKKERNVKMVLE